MRIRRGGPADIPVMLGMLDEAVAWLVENGRTGQWGTEPFSTDPRTAEHIAEKARTQTVWIAEIDGTPAGAMTVSPQPQPYVEQADEPEHYITLLVTARAFFGRGVGSGLLAHAREEARRAGVGLLRVDCYAGGDGRLVDYYRRNGFATVRSFTVGDGWPGRLLSLRVQ
jgi:GNAT superfamily N-acetyltransferase